MTCVRIIPRLDIKGPNLVKGIHLEGLRVLGKPEQFAQYYYEQGADELLYVDVVASLYGRNSILPIIERTARDIFIPLTVGGGLRTLDDITTALRAGADKVVLNTAAIRTPGLIAEAARRFGSSTIVVAIEAIRQSNGAFHAYTDNGREETGLDVVEWATRAASLGAGEILLTAVDQEGTGKGYACALTKRIAESVSIPVVACGGAGSAAHVVEVIRDGKVDAVAMASILHYDFIDRHPFVEEDRSEGNIEYVKSGRKFLTVQPTGLANVKAALRSAGILCRA
jgi:cyclase